ncbi:FTR1 family protein [Chroococcus sp. FPU101]|uniref:FTR1 family iron permease n=1 Tax=Chroococcus sp. FPU101 TaxID=1974212 RepID=UPI001A8CF484|nr:FTR1 family protein [Chroococcus sp. FPU101]GFE69447.1 iron permease FTR1 [Chroococcus sp. FPU101]
MNWSSALPTFVITLREGVEAALVVGIVLAYLKKSDRSQLNIWVWTAVGTAITASAMLGVLLSQLMYALQSANKTYAPVVEPLLEASFSVLAIILLSWMLIWMTKQSRHLKGQIEGAVNQSLKSENSSKWGIFSLIFIAVLREGFETVLFITAKLSESIPAALGAIGGLLTASGVGVALFKWGIRINLRRFFQIMGIILLFIVAGLVVTALGLFDSAMSTLSQIDRNSESLCFFYGRFTKVHSCVLGPMVWNLEKVLPVDRFPGFLLSSLFGYTDRLYLVQIAAYLGFLGTAWAFYSRSLSAPSATRAKEVAKSR